MKKIEKYYKNSTTLEVVKEVKYDYNHISSCNNVHYYNHKNNHLADVDLSGFVNISKKKFEIECRKLNKHRLDCGYIPATYDPIIIGDYLCKTETGYSVINWGGSEWNTIEDIIAWTEFNTTNL